MSKINAIEIKKDFPILNQPVNGKDLVYLDNAASAQKPIQVINSELDFYKTSYANVHRGIYTLSEESTKLYENARKTMAEFIGAHVPEEIIFTSGTTEGINAVAQGFALNILGPGDKVLVTKVEHHSNLVPWQQICKKVGAILTYVEMDENFEFPLEEIKKHFADGVKIFAFTHASNVLGNIYPAKEICRLSREYGVYTVLDGAQAVPHFKVNVQSLDCDFYAFSGHKMLGPSGIGVLYVRRELFEKFSPFKFGGGMIDVVTETDATWAHPPEKYEAGTPNIAGAVGLAAAARYLESIGLDNIREHEIEITKYALQQLQQIPNISILGSKNPENRTGIVSFTIKNIHAHDIASILNVHGVCVRSGHHCTMPLHTSLNLAATVRASYYLYNSTHDIDMLVVGLKKALEILV